MHVCVRIRDRVANARLRSKMHHAFETMLRENRFHRRAISDVHAEEGEVRLRDEFHKTRFFDARVVVIVDVVESDNGLAAGEQTLRDVRADETCCAGDKDRHGVASLRDQAMIRHDQA